MKDELASRIQYLKELTESKVDLAFEVIRRIRDNIIGYEMLKEYKCTKRVKAIKMSYHEAGRAGIVRDYDSEECDKEGYKVVYIDGYESWSPKDVFDKGYEEEPKVAICRPLGANCSTGKGQGAKELMPDYVTWGDSDTFKLISKFSSENAGVMKSTKAMQYHNGVVLQVTTQQRNPDGSYSVAEAVTNIPGASIIEDKDEDGNMIGRKIV